MSWPRAAMRSRWSAPRAADALGRRARVAVWSGRVTVQAGGDSSNFIVPQHFVGHLYVHGVNNFETAAFLLGCNQQSECVVTPLAQNLEGNLSLRRTPGSGFGVWQFTGASSPGNLHYALVGMGAAESVARPPNGRAPAACPPPTAVVSTA